MSEGIDETREAGGTAHSGEAAEAIPAPEKVRQRDWVPSLIWLIPILAAVIGISLAVKTWIQRGPEITIIFSSAEGLEAGKTKVKYKEVDIGTVQSIMLSDDRSHVLVSVQLKKEAKSFTASRQPLLGRASTYRGFWRVWAEYPAVRVVYWRRCWCCNGKSRHIYRIGGSANRYT